MQWNDKADAQILRILLRFLTTKNISIPYAEVAAEIAAEFGVTPKAVTHRLRKLKEDPANTMGENYGGGGESHATGDTAAEGEELASPIEFPTAGKGRRSAESKKKPSNKVRKGRVGKPGY